MTRYTNYKKKFNPSQHSSGDRVEKSTFHSKSGGSHNRHVDVSRMVQMRKKVCLKCRKRGHSLKDCPQNDSSTTATTSDQQQHQQGSLKCYKCGATDHTSKSCTITGNSYKFATCFYCNQTGHLASQCTQNPNGVYPKGGGCRFCGSVRHFAKDCDQRGGGKTKESMGAVVAEDDGLLEPVVDMQGDVETAVENKKPVKKVVSFK